MSDVEDVAHAVRFEAASLKDLVQRLVAALKSEQGAMLKLARLPALEAENETLRANFKKLQDESDRRFEQANADNLRLGEVWQSEKRRLESEVARTRDMVTTERENASRIRERMSTLAEELRAEALLTGRQADAAQTEQVAQLKALVTSAETERDAALTESTWLRRELHTVKEKLIFVQDRIHAKERDMLEELSVRNTAAEVRYTMESARLSAANKYDLI